MENYINSFKAHLYDRTSNPIIGSFIFYWLICNYKFILVLFSDISLDEKYIEINELYPDTTIKIFEWDIPSYFCENALLYPIVFTLIYIVIFPFFSQFLTWISIMHENRLKRTQQKKLLPIEEGRKLEEDLFNIEIKYYQLREENRKLKQSLEVEPTEKEVLSSDTFHYIEDKDKKIDKRELRRKIIIEDENIKLKDKILYLIGEYGNSVYSSSLQHELNKHPIEIEKEANSLIAADLVNINKNASMDNEHPYYITDKGKDYLYNHILNKDISVQYPDDSILKKI